MKYKGLSSKKVEELQEKYGKNVLTEVKKDEGRRVTREVWKKCFNGG